MTNDEKFIAITERISQKIPNQIKLSKKEQKSLFSEMAIMSYCNVLYKYNIIKIIELPPIEKIIDNQILQVYDFIKSLVEEFDWEPSDEELINFLTYKFRIIDPVFVTEFFDLLACIRDEKIDWEEVFGKTSN
jgi:hypothetical protein